MPSSKVSVAHRLGQEEAARRLKSFINQMVGQFGNQVKNLKKESWNGNTGTFGFEVMGMAISGVLNIEPAAVNVEAQYPMAAMMFKGKIESTMKEKLASLLA